jgi:hypothetical protein
MHPTSFDHDEALALLRNLVAVRNSADAAEHRLVRRSSISHTHARFTVISSPRRAVRRSLERHTTGR